jgi:hypothetical protein
MITGFIFARAAYIAAVYPAGPEPIIKHLICSASPVGVALLSGFAFGASIFLKKSIISIF